MKQIKRADIQKKKKRTALRSEATTRVALAGFVHRALIALDGSFADVHAEVEAPTNREFGDYATNIALMCAKNAGQAPHVFALRMKASLEKLPGFSKIVSEITIAGPGFINFRLAESHIAARLRSVLKEEERYGYVPVGKHERVQVEFLSANPTGPPHLGNGRGGFWGDALSNILVAAGYNVTREYYVNDAGEQIKKLGWSVLAAAGFPKKKIPYTPDQLYKGAYVSDIVKRLGIAGMKDPDIEAVSREASQLMLLDIKKLMRKLRIKFDVWFSEKSLARQGIIQEVLAALGRKNLLEEKDGATWLKLTREDIKDRVLVKSNGEFAYLLPDLAYHYDKFTRRRFAHVIDIFGADHHYQALTMQEAVAALGLPRPEIILMQFVRLIENGQEIKMSKRSGTFVTLEELVDEVGIDATRFFFLMREPNSHMDFDMSLAKEQSDKNPVYYVQYAHARCVNIIRQAHERNISVAPAAYSFSRTDTHSAAWALQDMVLRFPDIVEAAAANRAVNYVATYAYDVAGALARFYENCRVIGEADAIRQNNHLVLVHAARIVLANALRLLGVSAPQRM